MFARFGGTVESICAVDTSEAAAWIKAAAFEDWPQQRRLEDGRIRPAMVTDLNWHDFGEKVAPLVQAVMGEFPAGCEPYQLMLSAIMPGHAIAPHKDAQAPYWLTRVHVPLVTNAKAYYAVEGNRYKLRAGEAYRINTEREHAAGNEGKGPRIHFMFDVRTP